MSDSARRGARAVRPGVTSAAHPASPPLCHQGWEAGRAAARPGARRGCSPPWAAAWGPDHEGSWRARCWDRKLSPGRVPEAHGCQVPDWKLECRFCHLLGDEDVVLHWREKHGGVGTCEWVGPAVAQQGELCRESVRGCAFELGPVEGLGIHQTEGVVPGKQDPVVAPNLGKPGVFVEQEKFITANSLLAAGLGVRGALGLPSEGEAARSGQAEAAECP